MLFHPLKSNPRPNSYAREQSVVLNKNSLRCPCKCCHLETEIVGGKKPYWTDGVDDVKLQFCYVCGAELLPDRCNERVEDIVDNLTKKKDMYVEISLNSTKIPPKHMTNYRLPFCAVIEDPEYRDKVQEYGKTMIEALLLAISKMKRNNPID
jgi:hypothetical protein